VAKTPYKDLESQDILSAHVSGLQHDMNKLQEFLNVQISNEFGHALIPVNDQNDPSLRYKIYEGSIRNWMDSPEPIIYRNGSVVNKGEYKLQAPYGVIIFIEQQNSNDTITADFDYINNSSKTINDMNNTIDINSSSITQLMKPNNYAYLHVAGYYRTNNIINTNIETSGALDTNIMVLSMFVVAETTTL